jgi:hypothetical protein
MTVMRLIISPSAIAAHLKTYIADSAPRNVSPRRSLDLGCALCANATYLAERAPVLIVRQPWSICLPKTLPNATAVQI